MARPVLEGSLVGKVLDDRYEVLEEIGSGGVGAVYRGRRVKLDRMVAIKVLHESLVQETGFVRRFQREAVAMSRLHHPHCVAVTDFGVYRQRPYLILEYVPGQTVAKLVDGGPIAPPRAVSIALQLLETLEYFHAHHVIHRDLKAENVMLTESAGTQDFVKVLDFGMAKVLEGPGADSQLSRLGVIPGTPSAMAPEQINQLPPDPRIDIYATGILLYEMIVGHRPFRGDMAMVVKMQVSQPPQPPRQILGEGALSAELEQVILRALEKDRFNRFGNADDMAQALRATPEGRASGYTPPPPGAVARSFQPAEASRSRGVVYVAVAVAMLIGGLIAGVLISQGVSDDTPSPHASAAVVRAPERAPEPDPTTPTPTSTSTSAAASAAAKADPLSAPRPTAITEPWLVHRDLAVTYAGRGQPDEAYREADAALHDDAEAAAADPAIVDALVLASATGTTASVRQSATVALRKLGKGDKADLVAKQILDVDQADACPKMKKLWKDLARSKDPRVRDFATELRGRGAKDRHVKCLGKALPR